jgi:hypothetical protein
MMYRNTAAALVAAAFALPLPAAAQDSEIETLRQQIRQLEERLDRAEQRRSEAASPASAPTAAAAKPMLSDNTFNPAISLILDGKYRNLERDPDNYQIGGFVPAGGHGEDGHGHGAGPGERGFGIDESELTISANIDPYFSGYFTAALSAEDEVEVEEAFIQNSGFLPGTTIKFGRFFSAFGYQNEQHPHAWDFADAPLAHQAFFGGNLTEEGAQLRWVAPTPLFLEFGAEAGRGSAFPGSDRGKNGVNAGALFAHLGGDVGFSNSYRFGVSYRKTRAAEREYDDVNSLDEEVENVFSDLASKMWGADIVWKWAPEGNSKARNFKFQAEYFQRSEDGQLEYDIEGVSTQGTLDGAVSSRQTGWYAQAIYQFMPRWRAGLRYDELDSGRFDFARIADASLTREDFQRLRDHKPKRTTAMVDFSPSEFSRFRLQFARDEARFDETDNQIVLQYIMSLGAHGAHRF